MLQFDEMFVNEILTSNIPFNDLSFLGDMVNIPSASVGTHLTAGSTMPIDVGAHEARPEIPWPKPAQISPYGQQGDRVSGLDSLRSNSGPETPERHIPPGLFVHIDQAQSGFLGKRVISFIAQTLMARLGFNSTGATLATCIRESMQRYPDLSSGLNFQWLVQAGKHIAKFDAVNTVDLTPEQLPPKSLASMCISGKVYIRPVKAHSSHVPAAYFNNVHIYYPIIREQQFQVDWETLYDPNQKTHRVSNYILFCLVVTIGAASDHTNSATMSPLDQFSRDIFQKACALACTPMTESSLEALQVILLFVSTACDGSTMMLTRNR